MVETSSRGLLIGVEGIDAAGKRTQTSLLHRWLRSRGVRTRVLSFPDYSTDLGREIGGFLTGSKNYPPHVRHLLFAANRWERRNDLVRWLEDGGVLLVDRYMESNLAYGMANGLELNWLMNLEAGMPKTDGVVLLDTAPTAARGRRGQRNDKYENDLALQQRARESYRELATKFGWVVIDASREVKIVQSSVRDAVTKLFARHGQTI